MLQHLTREAYKVLKKVYNLFTGLCDFLSALKSHWRADTETAPSNAPALNGMPSPMSERTRSPSVSRSIATSV